MAERFRSRFVENGCERAHAAAEPETRAQILTEYSGQLESASPWQRFRLRREIERKVKFRLDKLAPRHALY